MTTLPICWDPNRVREVINTDAESVADAVFRAVHTAHDLQVAEPLGTSFQQLRSAAFRDMAPAEFLKEFLRPDRPHAQVAVIGRSGSGKSHLIHWLRSHVRPSESRLVLVIPKAGTSLRSVLDLIIRQLPHEQQRPFREQLDLVGDTTTTREGQKQRLLNEIAQAIREDATVAAAGEDAEVEEALVRLLPHIFQDPYLRERYFLQEDSVVASIVDHVFAAPNAYRRTEERRGFSIDDLPTGGRDYGESSKLARDALDTIYLDEGTYKPLAVQVINRNLNTAITRTLSFSGDRLVELMLAVRRYLKSQGQEMVLLIEDFARLQGIDRALLQALLTQGDDELCRIRWAIAVTTGFFESIAETVYTRMTYFVDMDRSIGRSSSGKASPDALAAFSSKYLNAVRLGIGRLSQWHENAGPDDDPPNACEPCAYRSTCHAAFGTANEVGLYPFTTTALWEMVGRADEQRDAGLNPRILQNAVLGKVLDSYAPALEQRSFPPRALLDGLGGTRHLLASDRARLSAALPADSDRLLTAMELWDGSGSLRDLPIGIREAFALPALPPQIGAVSPTIAASQSANNVEGDASKSRTSATTARDSELEALELWSRGGELPQGLAQTLRVKLFDLIVGALDWDTVGLQRSFYVAATGGKAFRRNSIFLVRQETKGHSAPVRLTIPSLNASEEEFVRTVIALQGVVEAGRNEGDWTFPGGAEKLVLLLNYLDGWTADVTRQLEALSQPGDNWRPFEAAAELLAVGCALAGRVKADSTHADHLSAMFGPWPTEMSASSAELASVYKRLAQRRPALVELLRSATSATKGGVAGALIDPTHALNALRTLRRDGWRPGQTPPLATSLQTSEMLDLANLYRAVAEALPDAASDERNRRLAWLDGVQRSFGEGTRRPAVAEELRQLWDHAEKTGIARNRSATALKEALDVFATVQFDDAVNAASALGREPDAVASLPHYGRGRSSAMEATTSLMAAVETFLSDAETELENRISESTASAATLDNDLLAIRASLEGLVRMSDTPGEGQDAA